MSPSSLLVFGPQTNWPTPEQAAQIRESILREPNLRTFLQAVRELPDFWPTLTASNPALERVPGIEAFAAIRHWLDHGRLQWSSQTPPNVLSTPLTVIIHIGLYFQYLAEDRSRSHESLLEGLTNGGIQGFCTGLLSAVAVASSKTEDDIGRLAAVALRLAVCIGAYVDMNGEFAEVKSETTCLATRWRSNSGREKCLEILERHPEAYISVKSDRNSVTITTSKTIEASLTSELSAAELLAKPIELEGRFHSSVHEDALELLVQLCKTTDTLQLPTAESLLVPVRSNFDAKVLTEGSLSEIVASSLLVKLADWHRTISAATAEILQQNGTQILAVGLSDGIPASVARQPGVKIIKVDGTRSTPKEDATKNRYSDDAVAIIGMSCKYAGADSVEEFWNLIQSGVSKVERLPESSRWSTSGLRRTKDGTPFWGNFVHDADAFDHRFFKKSSREAAVMDPQQRLLLQAAYEAVESSGYFGNPSPPEDIGCYIGVATTDYHDNISSHPTTAFSALGELRAFLCGRISYHFGWTGPSMTFDTACSASVVAIDAACKAIQSGQVSSALAGGVNVMTSPFLWENLRAANFLSPTGPTKPFDAKADGYCRGEGVGLVYLKKLSAAIEEGDPVLAVIAGSAVNQCKNETYITVPHGPSQTKLYQKLLKQSKIRPEDISFVEAHGTGTQAGDPVEIASIRHVLSSPKREQTLYLGSVKGNIGHCEAASGVASLIKLVLMLQHSIIPPLASHSSLNPKIPPLESDKMAIPTRCEPWKSDFRAGLVNNYGAAGNNGALIVCQAPSKAQPDVRSEPESLSKVPFVISAFSAPSLTTYCKVLREYVKKLSQQPQSGSSLAELAFNLYDRQNPFFGQTFATTASSLPELEQKLAAAEPVPSPTAKPVVLVFGGQTREFVGLDKSIYNNSAVFRFHLDHCNTVIRNADLKEIYPAIFQTDVVEDVVNLHCMFFAIQYACAKAWMESGLRINAVTGHSFGQLTALCISGCLSLPDAVRLVAGRASLMQQYWGPERGSMISLQANVETTSKIIEMVSSSDSGHSVEVACYNGPTSHVLVGSAASIDKVEQILSSETASLGTVRYRRLKVTYGFHSTFTEPLLPSLLELVKQLHIKKPTIPIETCSSGSTWEEITPEKIADHTRSAVYFGQAVQRISETLGPCTWLEAGGDSGVTGMIRHVFGSDSSSKHTYQGIKLTGSDAMDTLADSTVNLWKAGHKVKFWPFHRSQRRQYAAMTLPSYQFEKNKHWLEWKENVQTVVEQSVATPPTTFELVTRIQGKDKRQAQFVVDPRSEEYKKFVRGHAVLDSPLCPADLYVEIAHRAAMELLQEDHDAYVLGVEKLSIMAPLGIDPTRVITLSMSPVEGPKKTWAFTYTSNASDTPDKVVRHATGEIKLSRSNDPDLESEVIRYENLIGLERPKSLLADLHATGVQGTLVYQLFSRVVNYGEYYRGIKTVSSKGEESAAQIVMPAQKDDIGKDSLGDPIAVDNFVQVAGIKVNCLNYCPPNQVFICGQIDRIQASKEFNARDTAESAWTVYAHSRAQGEKDYINDIFVFNKEGKLAMLILGVRFTRVAISSLTKVLSGVNNAPATKPNPGVVSTNLVKAPISRSPPSKSLSAALEVASKQVKRSDAYPALCKLLNKVADVPLDAIKMDSTLEDLGVDSLMSTEVLSALQETFEMEISVHDFQNLQEIRALSEYLSRGSSSSPDSSSGSTTPLSTSEGTDGNFSSATSVAGDFVEEKKDEPLARLSTLISEQLEMTEPLLPDTCLGDVGLDSLLSVELASDIEKAFGVHLDHDALTAETTFGQLCVSVLGKTKTSKPKAEGVPIQSSTFQDVDAKAKRIPGDRMETVCFKEVDGVSLYADIYLPDPSEITSATRPIALMVHGGGHTVLSRKDIRPRQTQLLLTNGFLPVSIDYRLCPEINIIDGPITDVCDAYEWVRNDLPKLDLKVPGLRIDGKKVAVVGWSTGGTLSLTLGFNSLRRQIKPPDAILAFYCPSNYEADCWKQPNYPENSKDLVPEVYDLLEGVEEKPITAYNMKGSVGGWMSMADPRSRIILHMNWKGQALPILLGGLPNKKKLASYDPAQWLKLEQPSNEKIVSISPYSQIQLGNYRTPTYLIHGTKDDLIPWQQMKTTYEGLVSKGIPSGLTIVDDAPHLFDLYRDPDGKRWEAVVDGYKFLCEQIAR